MTQKSVARALVERPPTTRMLPLQGFYMFVRAVQLLTQRNDGTIVVRCKTPGVHKIPRSESHLPPSGLRHN